jgi:hypothetical protein
MMHISVALSLIGFITGGVAAWYWFKASKVQPVPTWARGLTPFEPVVTELREGGRLAGLLEAVSESARLNKIAAVLTGISVFFSALSVVFGVMANSN